jgi:phage antirepressor YoqD-like protein
MKEKLKNKDFLDWLKQNKIIYNEADNNLMVALYSEFVIENKKTGKNS